MTKGCGTSAVASQHPEVVVDMRKAYDQWWKETKSLMVNEDRPCTEEHPQWVRYEKLKAERGIPEWVEPAL